jgi:DNA replication protein DnaC
VDVPVGHPDFGTVVPCQNPVHKSERIARLEKTLNSLNDMSPADRRIRLAHINPANGNTQAIKAVHEFVSHPRGWLYIWGGPGNAKSIMLKALVNEMALVHKTSVYIKFTRIVDFMREAFSQRSVDTAADPFGGASTLTRFDSLKRIEFLAIDEMDKARSTPYVDEFRFDFMDERYTQALNGDTLTVFASNSPPDALPEALSSRIMDGRFMVARNEAGDARPMMRWNV